MEHDEGCYAQSGSFLGSPLLIVKADHVWRNSL